MKWSELEKRGIKRCCVTFKDGTRCRRRAADAFEGTWCHKHGPTMKAWGDYSMAAMRGEAKEHPDDR